MKISQRIRRNITKSGSCVFKLFSISLLLFFASPNYAVAYGGHGYSYGYGYGHHGYGVHYSQHGHIGTAGYIFLGILGIAILSQILDNDDDRDRYYRKHNTYNKSRPYKPPTQAPRVSVNNRTKAKPVFFYADNEGWGWLAKGNADHALDIFAIQSQQNMNSGIPKVGFSIAAATNGELDRATRSMRKAIRIDATALDKIDVKNIKPTIERLSEKYKLGLNTNNNTDDAFMFATLSYLQQDYTTANAMISENDRSQSANNLRKLILEKES